MASGAKIKSGTLLVLAAALLMAGCGDDPESARVPLGEGAPAGAARGETDALPPVVQAQLDSGNVAYRARDYQRALRHYQAAADLAPREPTTWFGVGMAAGALGDTELQRQAQARVQELAPQAETGAETHAPPGAAAGAAGAGPLPPGRRTPGAELPPGHPEVEGELPPGHPPVQR